MSLIYYGESFCDGIKKNGDKCINKAYYKCIGYYLCGVHAKNKHDPLPNRNKKNSEEIKSKDIEKRLEIIEKYKNINKENNKEGDIKLCKIYMMKYRFYLDGYLNIYPNYRDGNRKDGYGCSSLSPMFIGPIEHGQLNIPISKNLENFYQGSKCFEHEAIKNDSQYIPGEIFYNNRNKFFNDDIGHRRKYKGKPLFFVWTDKYGKEYYLDYISSRQFYCNFYERGVRLSKEFIKLKNMIKDGINIQICGYDAHEINKEGIEKAYLNNTKPFGHELVIYTMLVLECKDYPWIKFKTFDF